MLSQAHAFREHAASAAANMLRADMVHPPIEAATIRGNERLAAIGAGMTSRATLFVNGRNADASL